MTGSTTREPRIIMTVSHWYGGRPATWYISRRHAWDPFMTDNPRGELGWDRGEWLDALNDPMTDSDRDVSITVYEGGRAFASKAVRAYKAKGYRPKVRYRD